MRILGIDLGEKRIGLSISDEQRKIALPYKVIDTIEGGLASFNVCAELKKICQKEKIKEIVVGFPLTLKGEKGKKAKEVKELSQIIEKETKIPVIFVDERFTTKEAEKILKEEGIKSKRLSKTQKKGKIDILSAILILQSYLDKS